MMIDYIEMMTVRLDLMTKICYFTINHFSSLSSQMLQQNTKFVFLKTKHEDMRNRENYAHCNGFIVFGFFIFKEAVGGKHALM